MTLLEAVVALKERFPTADLGLELCGSGNELLLAVRTSHVGVSEALTRLDDFDEACAGKKVTEVGAELIIDIRPGQR